MGVVQVTKSQPRLVSSGRTPQVKPGSEVVATPVGTHGEQSVWKMVGNIAGGIFNKVAEAKENEEVSTFEGVFKSEAVKFRSWLQSHQGASLEDVQKRMQETDTNIKRASNVPTTHNGRLRATAIMKGDLPRLNEMMKADYAAIESSRMFENLKMEIDLAAEALDYDTVSNRIDEAVGTFFGPEQAELLKKQQFLRMDKLVESRSRAVQANLERKWIDDTVKDINGLLHKDRKAALGKITGVERPVQTEIEARVLRQMDVEMEEASLESRKLLIRETKGADGKMKADPDWSGAKAIVNANLDNFGTSWWTDELNKIRNAMSILDETGVNPYTTTTNWKRYYEDHALALQGNLDTNTVSKHTGPDGYSDKEASRLRGIIDDNGSSSDEFENSNAAELLQSLMATLPTLNEDQESLVEIKIVAEEKALGILYQAIQTADPPLTDKEKKQKALSVYSGIKASLMAGTITMSPSELKLPAGAKLEGAVKTGHLSVPTSQSDYDKLPKGTRYRHPDGTVRIKK